MNRIITGGDGGRYPLFTTSGGVGDSISFIINNNYKSMKETKKTKFKLVYQETKVTETTFDILAESLEDAKKKSEEGCGATSTETISVEVILK